MVYQAEYPPQGNCESAMEAVLLVQTRARGRCELPYGLKSPQGVRRLKEVHTGRVGHFLEDLERV